MLVGDDHLKAYLGGVVQGWFRVSRRAHKSPCFSESVAEHGDSTHPPERRTPRFAQCFGLLRTFSGTTIYARTRAAGCLEGGERGEEKDDQGLHRDARVLARASPRTTSARVVCGLRRGGRTSRG